jgi:preprotein translocase subunit SecF
MARRRKPVKTKQSKKDAEIQKNINETMKKIQQINEISRQKMRKTLLLAILGNIAIILLFVGLVFLVKTKLVA